MNQTKQTLPQPQVLGLKRSFGFGDRLGLATPGHLAAARKFNFAPIFAQQSIREMTRTQRTPEQVMTAARQALASAKYNAPWGADADHLKTEADIELTSAAGFTFFTIDPSAFVVNQADQMPQAELERTVASMLADGTFQPDWQDSYLNQSIDLGTVALSISPEQLHRAAVKYGRAIAYCAKMAAWILQHNPNREVEIEISVDETDSPTSVAEHFFFGHELKRRGVRGVVSVAPRFIGEMEKGIDYRGDLTAFEAALKQHVAVAKVCGPYKISVHSGSDKFAIYPAVGRICGDLLHVKTAGTSYLEALRAVCRKDLALFREIIEYCRGRFETDRQSYHISTTPQEVAVLPVIDKSSAERVYLDERPGRQLLHVTFGSVLTVGKRSIGQTFKEAVLAILQEDPALYEELLDRHFTHHLSLLAAG